MSNMVGYLEIPVAGVAKIRRNKERDKEEQKKLAAMGWHCITVWECELTPKKREETLESIAFTLNHIWLQDHQAKIVSYPKMDEEDMQMPMAAPKIPKSIIGRNPTKFFFAGYFCCVCHDIRVENTGTSM